MVASLLAGFVPTSFTLVGSTLRLNYETCCDADPQSISVNLSGLGGGGGGAFIYFEDTNTNAPAAGAQPPAGAPSSPNANDSLFWKFDDWLVTWTYNGSTWVEGWRVPSGDAMQSAQSPETNPGAWPSTPDRMTLIYSNNTSGLADSNDFLGYTDGAGMAHTARHFRYIQLTGSIGANPEAPTYAELRAAAVAQNKPYPMPGDIIDYAGAPSGIRYIYDICRDDDSTVFEARKRDLGAVQTTALSNPSIAFEDNVTNWPSLAPQHNFIGSTSRGLLLGVRDDTGTAYRVAQHQRIEMGKIGTVSTDAEDIDDLPLHPVFTVPNGVWRIKYAECTLATVGSSQTIFRIEAYPTADSTAGVLLFPTGVFTIPLGQSTTSMSAIIGSTIASGQYLALKVSTGSDAKHLNVVLYLEN